MPLATWAGGGDCQLPPPQSFRHGSTAALPPTPGRAGPTPPLLSPSPTPWEKGVTPPAGPPLRRGLAGARPGRRGAASSPAPAGGAATVAPPHNPTRKFPVTVPVGRACAAPPGPLPPPGQPPPEGRTRRRSGGGRRGREGGRGRGREGGRERSKVVCSACLHRCECPSHYRGAPIRKGGGNLATKSDPKITCPPSFPWSHVADGHDGFEFVGSSTARAEQHFLN